MLRFVQIIWLDFLFAVEVTRGLTNVDHDVWCVQIHFQVAGSSNLVINISLEQLGFC